MGSGHEMCGEIHDWIIDNIPKKSIILELGSGKGTKRLVDNDYQVYSVEHSKKWLNMYGSTYIHAPIKEGWYDLDVIKNDLPEKYDLLIVDGPLWKKGMGRIHMANYLDYFDTDCCMIFDDFHRNDVPELVRQVSEKVGRDYIAFNGRSSRHRIQFAVFEGIK